MTQRKLKERLSRADYDVAGFQVYSCSVDVVKDYLEMTRSFNKDVITIMGGAHPSCDPEGTMDYLRPDFAFRGEAEAGLPMLLEKLSGIKPYQYKDINNLIY